MNAHLRTRLSRNKGHEAGQGMVEFMLVITFLFVLFMSIMQIIVFMHAYNTLADAAKEGVRYAVVHGTFNSSCAGPTTSTTCTSPDPSPYTTVRQVVVNFAATSFQNLALSDVTVDYNPKDSNGYCPNGTSNACTDAKGNPLPGCNAPGCMVRVTVNHNFSPFLFRWPQVTLYAAAQGTIVN